MNDAVRLLHVGGPLDGQRALTPADDGERYLYGADSTRTASRESNPAIGYYQVEKDEAGELRMVWYAFASGAE